MANSYRETMTNRVLTQASERAALVEALIDGRIVEQASLWEIATMLRLPARGPYVVVAAECAALGKSALPGVEAKLGSIDISSAWRLLPDVQLGLVHVRSQAKFDALIQTLTRLTATRIGVSSRFEDLRQTPEGVTVCAHRAVRRTARRFAGERVRSGAFDDRGGQRPRVMNRSPRRCSPASPNSTIVTARCSSPRSGNGRPPTGPSRRPRNALLPSEYGAAPGCAGSKSGPVSH